MGKGDRCLGLTSPLSHTFCLEMWQRQPPGTVKASLALYMDRCRFHILSRLHYDIIVNNLIPKADIHRKRECFSEVSRQTSLQCWKL